MNFVCGGTSLALKDIAKMKRNDAGISTALGILKQTFGEAFQTGEALREQHAHTTTYIPAQLPDGVLFAKSSDDVQAAVEICAEHKVPIIPFGTGTCKISGGKGVTFGPVASICSVTVSHVAATVPSLNRSSCHV